MKKKTARTVIITVLVSIAAALITLFAAPYVKAEYLTSKHGHEFEGLELECGMLDSAEYLKVLEYRNWHAHVLYVGDGYRCLFCFDEKKGGWECTGYECIWSRTGSADDFLFMVLYQ